MSRINVTEKDVSWYTRQRGNGPLIICVVGTSSWGPTDRPVLCRSVDELKNTFKGPLVEGENDLSLSYNVAESLLKAGSSVLFCRVVDIDNAGDHVGSVDLPSLDSESFTLDVRSKYLGGAYLKDCTISFSSSVTSDGNITFTIMKGQATIIERGLVNLTDSHSKYYYKNEDSVSEYIKFEVLGDDGDPKSLSGYDFSELEFVGSISPASDETSNLTTCLSNNYNLLSSFCVNVESESYHKSVSSSLTNKYQFEFDVIAFSGVLSGVNDPSTLETLYTYVYGNIIRRREDTILLVDGLSSMTPDSYYDFCGNSAFGSSFCSAVGPWGYAKLLNTGLVELLPGSYPFLVAWAISTSQGVPTWMAPAGVKRASLDSFYVKPVYEISEAVLSSWQANFEDSETPDCYRINPIMKIKNYGYVIYGNSTLLHTTSNGETSMLQSLGTRVTANLIKREAFNIAVSLHYDQITNDLCAQFKTLLSVVLDKMKYTGALYDYRVIVDTSSITIDNLNDRRVPVTIQISPSPAVERFDINLEVSKAGVTFSDDESV